MPWATLGECHCNKIITRDSELLQGDMNSKITNGIDDQFNFYWKENSATGVFRTLQLYSYKVLIMARIP